MQDFNSFRIIGIIKELKLQKNHHAIPLIFDFLTIDGAILTIHVRKDVYENNFFSGLVDSTLVECIGSFEMDEISVILSLKKMFYIEEFKYINPF